MKIDVKSSGILFDELFTTKLKILNWLHPAAPDKLIQRQHDIYAVILERLGDKLGDAQLVDDIIDLATTDTACYYEQELLFATDGEVAGRHAKRVQELNAIRNQHIRKIDTQLGEGDISPTEKTYE